MLANNPHTHPMIFLKGMSFQTVHSILEFLYKGEVRIARDSVEEFLSEAEDLQISQFLLDTTEVSSLRPDIGQNSLQTEAGQADKQIKLFRESATEKIYKSADRYQCEDCCSSYATRNGVWYHRRAKHQTPATSC